MAIVVCLHTDNTRLKMDGQQNCPTNSRLNQMHIQANAWIFYYSAQTEKAFVRIEEFRSASPLCIHPVRIRLTLLSLSVDHSWKLKPAISRPLLPSSGNSFKCCGTTATKPSIVNAQVLICRGTFELGKFVAHCELPIAMYVQSLLTNGMRKTYLALPALALCT